MIKFLRLLGFKLHRWQYVGKWRCRRVCSDCGEVQEIMVWRGQGHVPDWWETWEDGDGGCGVPPLPPRWGF